jgi:acrylyl-CoA reductase (NADPH)
LRGVSLLGIDSVYRPRADREAAWSRLEFDLDRSKLLEMITEISLAEVPEAARQIVEGRVRGRIVVKIG